MFKQGYLGASTPRPKTQTAMTLALTLAFPMLAMAEQPEATDNSAAQTMSEVKVKAKQVVEAKSVGYQATKTRVGKTVQDPQDIAQAVTTLTRELLNDQQVGSLREALRNVVGLSINAAEGGRAGDNFNLRGFYTFGDLYLDNMRDTAQYNRETFNLEQVDVLRGAAAMLFGRGQAGGVINQVSKMAELRDKNTVTGSYGEYDYHQFTADFNKQLSDTVAIRINLMDRYEETYRKNPTTGDHPSFDRQGIAISFSAGIGTDNEFFLNHIYTQTRDVPDFGIRFSNKRPLNEAANGRSDRTFWGSNQNFDDSDTRMTTAIFTHKFSEDTQLRTQLRHANYKRAYWAKTPYNNGDLPYNFETNGNNVTRYMDYETVNLQSDFSTRFELAGMKHHLLTGIEYLKEDSYRSSLLDTNSSSTVADFSPHVKNNAARMTFDANNYAAYVQDSVELIPNWTLLAGVRRDFLSSDNYSANNDTTRHLKFGEQSYRSGLSWQPSPDRHYYLTYSDSFSPTADLYQLSVQTQPPERSRSYELGSKWLFLDGDLSFRTALFSTTKDWERNQDLEATASILTKRRRTNGIELEMTGKLTDRWDVFAGIALLDARIINVAENVNATTGAITVADARLEGERARNTPIGTLNLWTTYALSNEWKIGGGVEAKGERYAYNPSATDASASFVNGHFNPNAAPGYARVDLMATYEQPKWGMRLNVKNLLNKEYYDAVYDNGSLVTPGNKRQAVLTVLYKF